MYKRFAQMKIIIVKNKWTREIPALESAENTFISVLIIMFRNKYEHLEHIWKNHTFCDLAAMG